MDAVFPVHLKRLNGSSWYRIEAADRFTEVQRIGDRWLVHHVLAQAYPERVRVMELLAGDAGAVVPCTPEEFDQVFTNGRPLVDPAAPGGNADG